MILKQRYKHLLLVLLTSTLTLSLSAHEPDHSYIFLRIYENAIEGRVEILPIDLNRELGAKMKLKPTDAELQPFISEIESLILTKLSFASGQVNYPINWESVGIQKVDDMDNDFIKMDFTLGNMSAVPAELAINYTGFSRTNPAHRGLLIIEYNYRAGVIDNHTFVSAIFDSGETSTTLSLNNLSVWKGFWAMVKLGMWHIWIGLDHILFLVALLLPAVVRSRNRTTDSIEVLDLGDDYSRVWLPVASFRSAAWYMIKIVTFFTIAHSVTLAIAALGYVNISSRIVESIIAFSIALAALHNIIPIFRGKEWAIAFGFGLFHGFGFASVLGEKGLGGDFLVFSLLGFNVGVEIGQILIVLAVFPILFLIRRNNIYPKLIFYGSIVLIIIALQWFVERFFEITIPIGRWVTAMFS